MFALAPFLFGSRKAPAPTLEFAGAIPARVEAGRDDKALVQFHYDLSNDFYALFLDPAMVYSCAYFPDWSASLEEAQRAKLDIVCRKLRLAPGDRFLDIGCGWGGLVIHAAKTYGVQAHGVTLSQAQFDFAQARVAELGLADRVKIELKDYRELTGEYDKIASVGMFEHVGLDNHDAYFAKMHALLRVRGLLLNHAITLRAQRKNFRKKPPEYEAMTRYIFPGGELDHIGLSLDNLEIHEFDVHDVEGLREHYAKTCRIWAERLYARRAEAEAMIGEVKTHLWLLYLARCAIGFERGALRDLSNAGVQARPERASLRAAADAARSFGVTRVSGIGKAALTREKNFPNERAFAFWPFCRNGDVGHVRARGSQRLVDAGIRNGVRARLDLWLFARGVAVRPGGSHLGGGRRQ